MILDDVTGWENNGNGYIPWWRHQRETFFALLALCEGNSPVTSEFPAQGPVTRSFDVLFDLRLNKRLSKQSRGLSLETPLRSLWRHCNTLRRMRQVNGVCIAHSKNYAHIWSFDLATYVLPVLPISSLVSSLVFEESYDCTRTSGAVFRTWVNRPHKSIVIQPHQNDVGQNCVHISCDYL